MTSEQLVKQYLAKITHYLNREVRVVPVDRGLYDIFTGTGFSQWARYRKVKGKWVYVAGQRFNNIVTTLK